MQPTDDFAGGVFSGEIEGGRAGASISCAAGGLVAVTSEGQLFRVPFTGCQLERGGASNRMWFCRNGDRSITIFCEASGFIEALSVAARRELGTEIERLLAEQRASQKRTGWGWAAACLLLVGLLVGGYYGLRHAGRASVALLPHSVDRQLGDLALENMTLGGPELNDPVLVKAVNEIVKRLAPVALSNKAFTFRVKVVDAPTVNAFALPGGAIVVYTGLLRAAKAPEQVAGVIAHEMSHVTRRHGLQRIAQSVGVLACVQLLFGDVSGLAAVAVQVWSEGTINAYSRDHEHEADMDGVHTLARASVDPVALAEFFAALQKEAAGAIQLPAFLATHPDLDARIAEVREASKRSGFTQAKPFALTWADVQKHAGLRP